MQKDTALIICTNRIIWIGINSTPSTLCFYVYLPFHMRLNCSDKAHCSERKLVSDTFTFQEMRKFNLGGKWTWAHYSLECQCVFIFLAFFGPTFLFFCPTFWMTRESETSHLSSLRSRGRRLWECECRECQNSAGDRWWTPERQY